MRHRRYDGFRVRPIFQFGQRSIWFPYDEEEFSIGALVKGVRRFYGHIAAPSFDVAAPEHSKSLELGAVACCHNFFKLMGLEK
jgi:hypothetical protein